MTALADLLDDGQAAALTRLQAELVTMPPLPAPATLAPAAACPSCGQPVPPHLPPCSSRPGRCGDGRVPARVRRRPERSRG